MNKLTIKFSKPSVPINTLTPGQQVVETFDQWDDIPKPYPATKNVPDWFKHASQWGGKINTIPTVKKCPPFLDALTAGYIIPYSGSVTLTKTEKGHITKSSTKGSIFMSSHVKGQYESTPWKDLSVLKFSSPWIISTPPGWSCLFIHPLNDSNTKFKTLSGIVDTDTYRVPVNFPFLLDIEPGESIEFTQETAMVQVIPFKRQAWNMEIGDANMVEWDTHQELLGKPGNDAYKNTFHQKKKFT